MFVIDIIDRNDSTIQIQNDENLRREMVMNENGRAIELAELTAGGTSATVARRSHKTP